MKTLFTQIWSYTVCLGTSVYNFGAVILYSFSDALHAYFGVCGLSLLGEEKVLPMHAALNISQRAADRLKILHQRWRDES